MRVMQSTWKNLVHGNHLWKICAMGAVVPCISALYSYRAQEKLKQEQYYKEAIRFAEQYSYLDELIGKPYKYHWVRTGFRATTKITADNAHLEIPMTGAKSTGTLFIDASKPQNRWLLTELAVQVEKPKQTKWVFYRAESNSSDKSQSDMTMMS